MGPHLLSVAKRIGVDIVGVRLVLSMPLPYLAMMNGNLPSLRQAGAEHCLLCCSHSEPN